MSAIPSEELFPPIGEVAEKEATKPEDVVDEEENPVQEIESLCMQCGENGKTRLLLTSIPYFREVIVMSFRCEHCGWENNEIQSAGAIREYGTLYTVRVLDRSDLNRQLVKSSTASTILPEFQVTIPPSKGQLTTIEGLLRDFITDLGADQPLRRIQDETAYKKIQEIIDAFKEILDDDEDDEDEDGGTTTTEKSPKAENEHVRPFTVKLDDPAGNSFIEFVGSMADPKWNLRTYPRTKEQNVELGLVAEDESADVEKRVETDGQEAADAVNDDEVFVFPGTCSSCGKPVDTKMKKVSIPYFKDILIMSTNCDKCGYRDNEVKSGAAISEKGKRITLKVNDKDDLSRDILKSESCGLQIPEIELVLQPGTLGGRFTTLEGLLDQVYEELSEKVFSSGDSTTEDNKTFEKFLSKLKAVKAAEREFTVILEDPLANSYLQNIYAPDPDPNMTIETFERTWDQNEDLGLNDMKVENYEQDVEQS